MAPNKLLVADNNPSDLRDIQNSLDDLGYAVTGVTELEEAFVLASKTCPDLALIDIHLAVNLAGTTLINKLRSSLNIPVVFLAECMDRETLERARIAQPLGYIFKPYEKRELRNVVEMALCFNKPASMPKLQADERRSYAILSHLSDAVISVDMQHRVDFMNSAAASLLGWQSEEARGCPINKVLRFARKNGNVEIDNFLISPLFEGV